MKNGLLLQIPFSPIHKSKKTSKQILTKIIKREMNNKKMKDSNKIKDIRDNLFTGYFLYIL